MFRNLTLLFILLSTHCCSSQTSTNDSIHLLEWNSVECDNTYDPDRIKSRITNLETIENITIITINFSDNCCISFLPTIKFENGILELIPYTAGGDIRCSCDCCFTIEYKINGLKGIEFKVQFRGGELERSDDYYKTYPATSEIYNGKIINSRNKYRFQEGTWMTFYDDGSIKTIREYPKPVLYYEAYPIWSKNYFPSGNLEYHSRSDTIQVWFDDGQLKYESYEYTIADTTFTYIFSLYNNKTIKEKSLRKNHPVIFRSKYNDCYEGKGTMSPYAYKETYFENGQIEFLLGRDTIKKWYSNGQLKESYFNSKRIEYDSLGNITEKTFYWDGPSNKCSRDLINTLYIKFDKLMNVIEARVNRDQVTERGTAMGVNYYWKWNSNGELIKYPENWHEELPWCRFKEIIIPLTHATPQCK
jgi:hypothetical protein